MYQSIDHARRAPTRIIRKSVNACKHRWYICMDAPLGLRYNCRECRTVVSQAVKLQYQSDCGSHEVATQILVQIGTVHNTQYNAVDYAAHDKCTHEIDLPASWPGVHE